MKRVSACTVLLLLALAQSSSQGRQPQVTADLKRLVSALHRLEDLGVGLLASGANKKEIGAQVGLLARADAGSDFAGLDQSHAKAIREAWGEVEQSEAKKSGAAGARRKFLAAVGAAKLKYSPGFKGSVQAFWLTILDLQGRGKSAAENTLIDQAEEDSQWISVNLSGVTLTGEAKENFDALYRSLGDYLITRDPKILEKLAADLRVKTDHCRTTKTRADQPTPFRFETIDATNIKQPHWVVWAVPTTLPHQTPKRVGDPSTPVAGALLPGTYFFFAEKEGRETCWGEHTVAKGEITPANLLLTFKCHD